MNEIVSYFLFSVVLCVSTTLVKQTTTNEKFQHGEIHGHRPN